MNLYYHCFEERNDMKDPKLRRRLFWNSLRRQMDKWHRPIPDALTLERLCQDCEKKENSEFFIYNDHGKPSFQLKDLIDISFSISHAGRSWACVFHTGPVGMDLEEPAERELSGKRMNGIAARFFSREEQDFLAQLDGYDGKEGASRAQTEGFFRIWTMKEAYIKYTGKGIAEGLETFSVVGSGRPPVAFAVGEVNADAIYAVCTPKEEKVEKEGVDLI